MGGVGTFLESSTIHGLSYISTTRKYARLFWVLVVMSGFVGASLIIKESFDSWSDSPVKTTLETLPIAAIRLPKITVCPPKNTFTDLNYDLMMTENITLTKEMKDELFKYAVEVINEDSLSVNNWTKLLEKDRFYNWYHGYTLIESPDYDEEQGLTIEINTAATQGVVTTWHYGEQFRPELVDRKLIHKVTVYPPEIVKNNTNFTLHLKVEKVSMKGLSRGSKDTIFMGIEDLDADQTTMYTNFYISENYFEMNMTRDVSSNDVEHLKLDVMPGFNLSWWYSGADLIIPENKFQFQDEESLHYQFFR